jgi:cyclopropane fatty-acyl-phospholipid synthase-like methyltransferase
MGGRLLDLCSGDGFYDYYFYRRRASEIICLELNEIAYRYAVRLHSAPNIRHVNADVLHYEFPENYFDVVTIRGAIEHFTQENQQIIFQKALRALKPGGWFCGDTVANADKHFKMLEAHEFEWADEDEMRVELRRAFEHVETSTLVSQDRVTILWKCRKPERHVQSETPDVVFRW